MEDLEF